MKNYNYTFLLFICLVAALGGLLFGYDWVVIGGAKPFYELYFNISNTPSLQGWAISSALIGCIIGAALAGFLADRFGRKRLLIMSALFFTISAYGSGAAVHFNYFIIYRIIGGVGIGMASTLSPMFIAEVTPPKTRGMFVSINQLTIVIGILAAQITNMLISESIPEEFSQIQISHSWNGQTGWRWMFWSELIPACLFFILMFFVPESPRFLIKKGKSDKAKSILTKVGGRTYADLESEKVEDTLNGNKPEVSFKEIFSKRSSTILSIGIILAVFQQWCGINIIFNYAQEIFTAAGYNMNDLFMNIVITGSINLVFTVIAMLSIDKIGRKKLMLYGAGSLSLVYLGIGSMYALQVSGWPMLILVLLAIAAYAVSIAPVTWVIISEIFPNRFRGTAMAISTFSLWIASALLVQTFPLLNKNLGASGTFWVYGFICVLGFMFVYFRLPETKNKSLEEIEKSLFPKNPTKSS
ncbi:sugar porter family MFS transporter [Galbibacter pacificus]|uniref:Sugar porter family MFS transporter n=1 Tax=Galbibacter pacificus TaxID=2996052 RepID=A0ABT6FMU3_9FLAO|nr:sugar porter family MFS transporter [Galbibacter pacificus]MDG3581092.1 sugar porter family MFS transporter [Galbibacter pacificus]MDG3584570.1 sugar porter family MFS transporter [Galbibacter pacificus]